ncbi:hypothetical protein Tco_1189445, partial [Tanacetum coccineum]
HFENFIEVRFETFRATLIYNMDQLERLLHAKKLHDEREMHRKESNSEEAFKMLKL